MLEHLQLHNVGPAPAMEMHLAPRLNLITGDNGLGKSFLLDVMWWALTRRWPHEVNPNLTSGYMARPIEPREPATIAFALTSKTRSVSYTSTYSPRDEAWIGKAGRPWNPGLVLYAHVDGGFSVWDPARNYWRKKRDVDVQDRLPAYVFSAKEVWDGLEVDIDGRPTVVCNGLVRDWASWVREGGEHATKMAEVLRLLSPSEHGADVLRPGPLTRLSVNDARDVPSLRTAYTDAVPVLHASSGIRRIVALAYMLLWSWHEHRLAASQLGEPQTSQVVMLIDEIEAHLHPRWQRSILRSIIELVNVLHEKATIQLVTATHSALILASAETMFDPARDAWFDLDLVSANGRSRVELAQRPWVRHGDVSAWLTSEAFDLGSARSLEAEQVVERASRALSDEKFSKQAARKLHAELRKVLGDTDPFWMRWRFVGEKKGWLP